MQNIFARNSQEFVKLHFGGDSLECTPEHPFFVNNDWVAAGELKAGDSLFSYSGEKVKLDSVFSFRTDTAKTVYNLEASGNHNYYVSASKVLVHNKNPKLLTQFSTRTIDDAVSIVMKDPNKINHLFASKHNLSGLIKKFGGKENTLRNILEAANGKLPANGIFNDIPINIGGKTVFLRGNVINGVPRIGTMYIK